MAAAGNLRLVKTANLLREAIPRMSQLGIPVTPENYHTWYEYTMGTCQPLIDDIDELLSTGAKFTNKINKELYLKHVYQSPEETLEVYQKHLQNLVNTLFEKISGMTQKTRSFSGSLEKYASVLETSPDIESVTEVISRLIDDTGSVIQSNNSMATMLDRMNNEVETLYDNLQTLNVEAYTDQLTGVPNRRAFDKSINDLLDAFQDEAQSFSLILIDIDHFKKFNDTHGHAIGDKVLKYVAKVMKSCLKNNDMLARYGGEEFVLLLPNVDYASAIAIGDRVREKVSSVKLIDNEEGKDLGYVTISMGVAVVSEQDDDESIVKRADRALYLAKENGRNRVVGEQALNE